MDCGDLAAGDVRNAAALAAGERLARFVPRVLLRPHGSAALERAVRAAGFGCGADVRRGVAGRDVPVRRRPDDLAHDRVDAVRRRGAVRAACRARLNIRIRRAFCVQLFGQ